MYLKTSMIYNIILKNILRSTLIIIVLILSVFYLLNYLYMNAIIETNWLLTTNNLFYKMWEFLQKEWHLVNIKWKLYPNRIWFRKLAMFLWISLEIVKEARVDLQDYFIYEYSVRAISKDWRFADCSASCSSKEKDFNHLENDVRAIAQTRASNRAISDLLWITDLSSYVLNKSDDNKYKQEYILESDNNTTLNTENRWFESIEYKNVNIITERQKKLLEKLILEIYEDSNEQNIFLSWLDELTKSEANQKIKELLDIKNS